LSVSLLAVALLAAAPVDGPVAVFPFKNLNADTKLDWLKLGIAESMLADLKKSGKVAVVERAQIDHALAEIALQGEPPSQEASASRAGKLVGARTVVLGSFQRSAEMLRINARFVTVETGLVVDAVKATGTLAGVFALQDEVVDRLIGRPPAERPKRKQGKAMVKAFQLYAMSVAVASDAERIGYLESSLAADPDFVYARDELSALEERMQGYSKTAGERVAGDEAATLARVLDAKEPAAARVTEAATLVDTLCAARRFHSLVRVGRRLGELPGEGFGELAAWARVSGELGRHHFDAGLSAGEDFLKRFPVSVHFREAEHAMSVVVAARRRAESRQKEYETDVAELRQRAGPAAGRSPDKQRDWDYAPCLASRWNSLFGEPMFQGCSEFLRLHENDAGDEARERVNAARFFMVLARAERGELDTARALSEALRAQTHAWDDQLQPLMADWPTDTEADGK
jgi:TolB-like protein